jgi:hypothetical protein
MTVNAHTVFQLNYQKIKAKHNKSSAAGADDPDFYSAETNVDTKLTNVLQADPILEASTIQEGPATVLTAGGANQLRESVLCSNQEVPGVCPSPPHQLIDWMNQALTVLLCGEEQASPSYNVNFKVQKQSTSLQPSYSHCSIANGFVEVSNVVKTVNYVNC